MDSSNVRLPILVLTGILLIGCGRKEHATDQEHKPAGIASHALPLARNATRPETDPLAGKDLYEVADRFSAYSPAQIQNYLKDSRNFRDGLARSTFARMYLEYLASLENKDTILSHLRLFSDNYALSHYIERLAEKSPIMTPEFAAECLEAFGSETAQRFFSLGLKRRIGSETDANERLKLAKQYINSDIPAGALTQVVGSLVDEMQDVQPDEIESWLLSLPEDLAVNADGIYVRRTAMADFDRAVNYVQDLFDLGQHRRAINATGSLLAKYKEQDPRGALDWALQLPDTMDADARELYIKSAYSAAKSEDPEAADALLRRHLGDNEELIELIRENDRATRERLDRNEP